MHLQIYNYVHNLDKLTTQYIAKLRNHYYNLIFCYIYIFMFSTNKVSLGAELNITLV